MMAIAQLINMRSQGKASLSRINELLEYKVEINNDLAKGSVEIKGDIRFNNLSFTYPNGDTPALTNINLHIKEGEKVGIIGKTGSGKTTLVDMLTRMYNLPLGTLFIDGVDVMEIPLQELRKAIGYVPQDNFLFSDTISSNIALGIEQEDQELIQKYAKLSVVDENIQEFPNKYQTILGERGVTLSGGQRQRVSIARALIKNAKILILDDSVSAVDTKTEETIIDNLQKIRQHQTTILIAHRVSTVQQMDKIVVIDEGKIIAEGTHEELMQNSLEYQEIVRLQKLEDEVGEKGGDVNA